MNIKLNATLLVGLLLAFSVSSWAATVTLTATDSLGETSYNTGLHWSDSAAPGIGNDYVVPLQWLRTPTGASGTYVFTGDSLTLTGAGGMIFKSDNSTHVIDNLILADGGIIWGGNTPTALSTLEGNIMVVMTGTNSPTIHANQSAYIINSDITGSGDLTLAGGSQITLNGMNSMAGNIIVAAGTKTFSSSSFSAFTIGADGVNNAIIGTGAVFDGQFDFDLTAASTTVGDSWALATAGATFSSNFVVNGFTDNEDGSWYLDNGTGKYKFYEDTGFLQSVSGNVFPITTANLAPANESSTLDTQPQVSVTLLDGSEAVVLPASIVMSVAGSSVTPGVTSPGNGTHLVSYIPTAPLAAGPVSVQLIFEDDSAIVYTNAWSFSIHPSTTDKLWNINIAGNNNTATPRDVTDGVFAVAPSAGANLWNNLTGNNSSLNLFAIYDTDGGNEIGFETSGSHNWGESTANGITVEMFQGWTGANAPMNMTGTLTGLDSSNAYDIYVYSTWRWTQNPVNYEIVEGFAEVTSATITEIQANVQNAASNDYSGCVYGENYIIFTNVTPSVDGRIAFTGVSSDGVLSGLQVLEVPGAGILPELLIGGSDPAANATFVSTTPTLTAYFVDVTETVNSGSIVMTVDGTPVSASFAHSNPTSAVSYMVTSSFDPETTHTAKVIVASSPSGALYTNEWSFTVQPEVSGNRVYVDADTFNTLQWDGASYSVFNPDGTGSNWTTRTALGNNAQVYQSLAGGAQRLKTEVSGLPTAAYDVYAYMWVQGNDWRIAAALADNLSGELPLYLKSEYPAKPQLSVPWAEYAPNTWGNFATAVPTPYYSSDLTVNPFAAGDVMVAEADRRLMEVYVGRIYGTEFTVYVDDDPSGADRTWYDGVGYEEVTGGPSSNPDIQSFIVSGGNATLVWTSEFGATYSIMHRSQLPFGTWTAVQSGIIGEEGTTTYAVPVSGADQEFFRVEAP